MSITAIIEEVEKLTPAEQEQVLRAVMEMVGGRHDDLTASQQADLRRRIDEADAHPERSRPWDEVKEQIKRERLNAPRKGNASRET